MYVPYTYPQDSFNPFFFNIFFMRQLNIFVNIYRTFQIKIRFFCREKKSGYEYFHDNAKQKQDIL